MMVGAFVSCNGVLASSREELEDALAHMSFLTYHAGQISRSCGSAGRSNRHLSLLRRALKRGCCFAASNVAST